MRKTFTTTIREDVQELFKDACKSNKTKMNDILEVLMSAYANGEITIEAQTHFKVVETKK